LLFSAILRIVNFQDPLGGVMELFPVGKIAKKKAV